MSSVAVMTTTSLLATSANTLPKLKMATRSSSRVSSKRCRVDPDPPFRCCDGLSFEDGQTSQSSKVTIEDVEVLKKRRTIPSSSTMTVDSPRMSSRLQAKRKRGVEDIDGDAGRILVKAVGIPQPEVCPTPTRSTVARKRRRQSECTTAPSTPSTPVSRMARPLMDSPASSSSCTPVRHSARLERKRADSEGSKEQRAPEPEVEGAGARSRSLGRQSRSRTRSATNLTKPSKSSTTRTTSATSPSKIMASSNSRIRRRLRESSVPPSVRRSRLPKPDVISLKPRRSARQSALAQEPTLTSSTSPITSSPITARSSRNGTTKSTAVRKGAKVQKSPNARLNGLSTQETTPETESDASDATLIDVIVGTGKDCGVDLDKGKGKAICLEDDVQQVVTTTDIETEGEEEVAPTPSTIVDDLDLETLGDIENDVSSVFPFTSSFLAFAAKSKVPIIVVTPPAPTTPSLPLNQSTSGSSSPIPSIFLTIPGPVALDGPLRTRSSADYTAALSYAPNALADYYTFPVDVDAEIAMCGRSKSRRQPRVPPRTVTIAKDDDGEKYPSIVRARQTSEALGSFIKKLSDVQASLVPYEEDSENDDWKLGRWRATERGVVELHLKHLIGMKVEWARTVEEGRILGEGALMDTTMDMGVQQEELGNEGEICLQNPYEGQDMHSQPPLHTPEHRLLQPGNTFEPQEVDPALFQPPTVPRQVPPFPWNLHPDDLPKHLRQRFRHRFSPQFPSRLWQTFTAQDVAREVEVEMGYSSDFDIDADGEVEFDDGAMEEPFRVRKQRERVAEAVGSPIALPTLPPFMASTNQAPIQGQPPSLPPQPPRERIFPKQHPQLWHRRLADHRMEPPVWKWASMSRVEQSCEAYGTDTIRAIIASQAALATRPSSPQSLDPSSPQSTFACTYTTDDFEYTSDIDADADLDLDLDADFDEFDEEDDDECLDGIEAMECGEETEECEADGARAFRLEMSQSPPPVQFPELSSENARAVNSDLNPAMNAGERGTTPGSFDAFGLSEGLFVAYSDPQSTSPERQQPTQAQPQVQAQQHQQQVYYSQPPQMQQSPPLPWVLQPLSRFPAICLRDAMHPVAGFGTPAGEEGINEWKRVASGGIVPKCVPHGQIEGSQAYGVMGMGMNVNMTMGVGMVGMDFGMSVNMQVQMQMQMPVDMQMGVNVGVGGVSYGQQHAQSFDAQGMTVSTTSVPALNGTQMSMAVGTTSAPASFEVGSMTSQGQLNPPGETFTFSQFPDTAPHAPTPPPSPVASSAQAQVPTQYDSGMKWENQQEVVCAAE